MKPKQTAQKNPQGDLFRIELQRIVDRAHSLIKLAETVDWTGLEANFGQAYCEDQGRPAISTRLMVALQYLKYAYNLSDEETVRRWVENPYWQYFSGMKWFEHEMPINPSSMTRWRKRIGKLGAEELLIKTLEAGLVLKAVKPSQLKRVNVDTTVQEKHVRFPTDSRLYNRARERLVKAAEARGIRLRQNYNRVAKKLEWQQSRYAHARQMKRARRCTRKLRTILGRVVRDIERKCGQPDEKLRQLIEVSQTIHKQQRQDKGKTYSVHAPEVECISKGKAHKRYEFGCKVGVAATSRGGWFVGAQAYHGNPYDGHTLSQMMEQIARIASLEPEHVYVDQGYRGHGYEGKSEVHVDRKRRGGIARSMWKWMKRRAAIEPGIGHLKSGHRMDRNRLKGKEGDEMNAILSAAGMNFRKLLKHAASFLRLLMDTLFAPQRLKPRRLFAFNPA
jgi:transposase, IS5 family